MATGQAHSAFRRRAVRGQLAVTAGRYSARRPFCEILPLRARPASLAHMRAPADLGAEAPMVTDLAALVAEKIRSGVLPLPPEPPAKYFGGKGSGQRCDVCEQPITADQLEYETDIAGRTLRFHETCVDMWRQARG